MHTIFGPRVEIRARTCKNLPVTRPFSLSFLGLAAGIFANALLVGVAWAGEAWAGEVGASLGVGGASVALLLLFTWLKAR